MRSVLSITRVAPLLLVPIVLFGCSSSTRDRTLQTQQILLHVEYRAGGDAPVGFLLTLFDTGDVRFYSPRAREYWRHLDPDDLQQARNIGAPGELQNLANLVAKEHAGYRFGCCDDRELGVTGSDRQLIGIPLEGEPLSDLETNLLQFVNHIGVKYFGRSYSLPLSTHSSRGLSGPRKHALPLAA